MHKTISKLYRKLLLSSYSEQWSIGGWALLFLALNAAKVALFSIFILPNAALPLFLYKFEYSILILGVLYLFIFKCKKPYALIIFYFLQMVFLFAELVYYRFFHSYLHIAVITQLFDEGIGATTRGWSVINDVKLAVNFIDLPVFIYILCKYSPIRGRWFVRAKIFAAYSIAILLLLFIELWSAFAHNGTINYLRYEWIGQTMLVERYGTVVNSIVGFMQNATEDKMIENIQYGKELSSATHKSESPSFIIIQVESLGSDLVNRKYKGEYIIPFINSLAQTSICYPYMMCYHNAGGTSDSEVSALNSIEPLSSYPIIKSMKYDYPNSLIKKLTRYSYGAYAFHSNEGAYYNRNVSFPKMGFHEFNDIVRMGLKEQGWGASDGDLFEYIKGRLYTQSTPFLYYIITMSSHDPYTSVPKYYNNPSYNDIKDVSLRNYYRSMSYTDNTIREFVSYVTANSENTYVFIFGDHTAPNIQSELYKPSAIFEDNNYIEFVPLFIITPDNKKHLERRQVASTLDIAPTILELSGLPFSIKTDGVNLANIPIEDNNVPIKAKKYDRNYLYMQVDKQMNSQIFQK